MATRENKPAAAGRRGSPLLRRCKRDGYTHGLRPPQMEALRAMCGALIPSLPAVLLEGDDQQPGRGKGGDDLERFYRASAADGVIPDEVSYERLRLSMPSCMCHGQHKIEHAWCLCVYI
jgi:long-chain-alcohol oxidase